MSNRNESYLATSTTLLNADFWNAVIRDVSARISTLEGLKAEVEALTNLARDLAVQRVNVALAEYVTMIEGVAQIGALQTVLATGSASVGLGTKTITVQLQDRDIVGTTGYVVVRPLSSTAARMSGPITGYSAESGELQFEVIDAVGEGTETAWVVGYANAVTGGNPGPPGPAPEHDWDGATLRFRNPDGSWAEGVNLAEMVNLSGYYTKEEIDEAHYTKVAIEALILANHYTKTQIDAGWYTKAQADAAVPLTIAGLAVGAVGTYAFMYKGTSLNPGDTVAGSDLAFSTGAGSTGGGTPAGTWRCMGKTNNVASGANGASLFMRIA